MNESVCLSRLAEVKYTKHGERKKTPSEEENVVEEVEKKGVRARKFSSASTWCLVCEFLRPRLQRSEAKKAQGGHPPEQRQREKAKVPR